MANQQLVDYIKSQLKVGVTKDDLRKAVADAGWTAADAQAAFDVVEGKAPAAPIPPPIQPKPITPIQPINPQMMPAQPLRPVVRARPRHRYLPWLIGVLVVVAVVAAAFYVSPTLRAIAEWYLAGMPAPSTSTLVPVEQPVTTTIATTTSATATTTATTTPTNIVITSTSTASTTP